MSVDPADPISGYTKEQIETISDTQTIRLRPGMYIGNTGSAGLHCLLLELLANSLDEVKAGHGTCVGVTLFADGSIAVADDGRGVSVRVDPVVNRPAVVAALTLLGYSPKLSDRVYRVSLGLHGLGLKVVTALSEWGELDTFHAGEHHHIEFERGAITSDLRHVGPANGRTGTVVRFKPDPELFGDLTFDLGAVLHTLCELAFLHSGVRFAFTDDRTGKTDTFHYPDGLSAFVTYLNTGEETLHEPIRISGKNGAIGVEVAFQYTTSGNQSERGYSNGHWDWCGGTHVAGFRRGYREALRAFEKRHGCWPAGLTVKAEDIRFGVAGVVSIDHPNPQYEGATRSALNNADVEPAVARIVHAGLADNLETHPELGKRICRQVRITAEAREAARLVRRTRK
jgi:DNA gyrase subunit B